MSNGSFVVPDAQNEPVLGYVPGSPERAALKRELERMSRRTIDIPARIGGRRVRTGRTAKATMPHDHQHVLAEWHKCGKKEVDRAIRAALDAHESWSRTPWHHRAAIFLKAAELLAGPYRQVLNAATMLGQSKTVAPGRDRRDLRADRFLPFQRRVHAADLPAEQPESAEGVLELPGAPAPRRLRLRRHAVQLHQHRRQPAHRAGADGQHRGLEAGLVGGLLGPLHHGDLLEEAGLPPGVINMVPGSGGAVGDPVLASPRPRRHPLHRLHRGVQGHVEARSARTSKRYKLLPAHRRRDGRQGLRLRPPVGGRSTPWSPRWSAAPSSTRARSARRRAAPSSRSRPLAPRREAAAGRDRRPSRWATRRLHATSWAR